MKFVCYVFSGDLAVLNLPCWAERSGSRQTPWSSCPPFGAAPPRWFPEVTAWNLSGGPETASWSGSSPLCLFPGVPSSPQTQLNGPILSLPWYQQEKEKDYILVKSRHYVALCSQWLKTVFNCSTTLFCFPNVWVTVSEIYYIRSLHLLTCITLSVFQLWHIYKSTFKGSICNFLTT